LEAIQLRFLDFGNDNGVLVSDEEYETYVRCKSCGTVGRIAVIRHLCGMHCPSCKGADFERLTRQQVDAVFREDMRNGYKRISEKDWDGRVCEVCGEPAVIRLYDGKTTKGFFCMEHYHEYWKEMENEADKEQKE
jgi:hypothetical protein